MKVFKAKLAKNPESNILPEQDGTWRVQVRLKLPDGSMFNRELRNIATLKAARTRRDEFFTDYNLTLAGVQTSVKAKTTTDPKGLTLKDWTQECIDKHWPRNVPITARDYSQAMKKYIVPRLGDHLLTELTPNLIRETLYEIAETPTAIKRGDNLVEFVLSTNSVKAIKTAFGSCLAIAVDHRHIQSNPCSGLKMKWTGMEQKRKRDADGDSTDDGRIRLMTQEEIERLITEAEGTPIHAMVVLQAKCGLRISEALAVRPQDFDLKRGVLKVRRQLDRVKDGEGSRLKLVELKTKGSKRDIPIPKSVRMLAENATDPDRPLTANELGQWLEPRKAYTYWDIVVTAAELDPVPSPHDLRRNFISHLLNNLCVPATVVQALAGHSDVHTTLSFYSKASDDNLKHAMAQIA